MGSKRDFRREFLRSREYKDSGLNNLDSRNKMVAEVLFKKYKEKEFVFTSKHVDKIEHILTLIISSRHVDRYSVHLIYLAERLLRSAYAKRLSASERGLLETTLKKSAFMFKVHVDDVGEVTPYDEEVTENKFRMLIFADTSFEAKVKLKTLLFEFFGRIDEKVFNLFLVSERGGKVKRYKDKFIIYVP